MERMWNLIISGYHSPLQFCKFLHHHITWWIEMLGSCYLDTLLSIPNLISGWTIFCLDYHLNFAWHTFNEMILSMVSKVIPQKDNCTLHLFYRYNITKFLWDSILYVCPNVLNGIQIRRIWGMLVALHCQFQSDWNTNLFVDRSIVFHDNWLFQILKWLFSKLLKRSCKNLVWINSRVDLSICQLKKQSRFYLTPTEYPPEHYLHTSRIFSVINTTKWTSSSSFFQTQSLVLPSIPTLILISSV